MCSAHHRLLLISIRVQVGGVSPTTARAGIFSHHSCLEFGSIDVKRQDEFLPSLNVVITDLKGAEKFSNITPVKDTVSVILATIRVSLLLLCGYLSQADKMYTGLDDDYVDLGLARDTIYTALGRG